MTSYTYNGEPIVRSEAKRIVKWQFIICIAIAISSVCGLLITQEIFSNIFEYGKYDKRILVEAQSAYKSRFEVLEDKFVSKMDRSKLLVINKLCKKHNMGKDCEVSLLAIGWVESRWNMNAYLENTNNSVDKGFYQINSIHNFKEYGDFEAETEWTIKNLVKNGWFENKERAMLRHHSRTKHLQERYSKKIKLALQLIN